MSDVLGSGGPGLEARIRAAFEARDLVRPICAELFSIEPDRVAIGSPFRPELCERDGFFRRGVLATLAADPAGFAASSPMAPDRRVPDVEFEIDFLAPAVGARAIARGDEPRAARRGRRFARRQRTARRPSPGHRDGSATRGPTTSSPDRPSREPSALSLHLADDVSIFDDPRLPRILRPRVVDPLGPNPAARLEALFAKNGRVPARRDGIWPFSREHSTSRETLGIARGPIRVRFGGARIPFSSMRPATWR